MNSGVISNLSKVFKPKFWFGHFQEICDKAAALPLQR